MGKLMSALIAVMDHQGVSYRPHLQVHRGLHLQCSAYCLRSWYLGERVVTYMGGFTPTA